MARSKNACTKAAPPIHFRDGGYRICIFVNFETCASSKVSFYLFQSHVSERVFGSIAFAADNAPTLIDGLGASCKQTKPPALGPTHCLIGGRNQIPIQSCCTGTVVDEDCNRAYVNLTDACAKQLVAPERQLPAPLRNRHNLMTIVITN